MMINLFRHIAEIECMHFKNKITNKSKQSNKRAIVCDCCQNKIMLALRMRMTESRREKNAAVVAASLTAKKQQQN